MISCHLWTQTPNKYLAATVAFEASHPASKPSKAPIAEGHTHGPTHEVGTIVITVRWHAITPTSTTKSIPHVPLRSISSVALAPTSAAASALILRRRTVDSYFFSSERVRFLHHLLHCFWAVICDEANSAVIPRNRVFRHVGICDGAVLGEMLLEFVFRRGCGDACNEYARCTLGNGVPSVSRILFALRHSSLHIHLSPINTMLSHVLNTVCDLSRFIRDEAEAP
mmetsp:Transcript_5100/g.18611  ORF Transcript_5100/g.18611 Transcript_5100/m.18611 type:complete len:225 (-) Transcript_5100:581-1255(-)